MSLLCVGREPDYNRRMGIRVSAQVGLLGLLTGCGIVSKSPCSYSIVFYSNMNTDLNMQATPSSVYNLFTVNADGNGLTALTQATQATTLAPMFLSKGGEILFTSNFDLSGSMTAAPNISYNLWKMKIDGTGLTPLNSFNAVSSYAEYGYMSPDETRFAFHSRDIAIESCANLYTAKIDGTDKQRLTTNTTAGLHSLYAGGDFWSPDGTKILIMSKMALSGVADATAVAGYNLWIMNLDGSGKIALTRNTVAIDTASFTFAPKFTVDGQWIYFRTQSVISAENGAWDGTAIGKNIWRVRLDGTGLQAITRSTNTSFSMLPGDFLANDVGMIAQGNLSLTGLDSDTPNSSSNIWAFSMDGATRRAQTFNTSTGLGVASVGLSPDKAYVLYRSYTALDGSWNGSAAGYNLWRGRVSKDGGVSDRRALTTSSVSTFNAFHTRNGGWYQTDTCR